MKTELGRLELWNSAMKYDKNMTEPNNCYYTFSALYLAELNFTPPPLQVYGSTEHLATPSNLSFYSDRSHSEDKEDRWDCSRLTPSPGLGDQYRQSSVELRHPGHTTW